MSPEDAVGMGTRGVLGALPAGSADLYGPKHARGYAGCPLGGPGLDFRAENAKLTLSMSVNFSAFFVVFVYLCRCI